MRQPSGWFAQTWSIEATRFWPASMRRSSLRWPWTNSDSSTLGCTSVMPVERRVEPEAQFIVQAGGVVPADLHCGRGMGAIKARQGGLVAGGYRLLPLFEGREGAVCGGGGQGSR